MGDEASRARREDALKDLNELSKEGNSLSLTLRPSGLWSFGGVSGVDPEIILNLDGTWHVKRSGG